jgi:hypothetical protein
MFVPVFFTVTVAPGTAAPFGSDTVPVTVPLKSWAETAVTKVNTSSAMNKQTARRMWLVFIFPPPQVSRIIDLLPLI